MVDKKMSSDYFKDWLDLADPVIKEQFPNEQTVLKVAKTLCTVKFRTRYNCHIDDCEHPDPVSVIELGRAESLDHLVQRLTGKQNPTMRDLSYIAIKGGSDGFEDPLKMTDEEIDERMERVVAVGDKIAAAEALQQAITEAAIADEPAHASEDKRATQEQARTSEVSGSESSKGDSNLSG